MALQAASGLSAEASDVCVARILLTKNALEYLSAGVPRDNIDELNGRRLLETGELVLTVGENFFGRQCVIGFHHYGER